MHTPVVCICVKNENQANKRPSMALCGRTRTQMRQTDGMKENLTKINGTAGNNHDGEKEK